MHGQIQEIYRAMNEGRLDDLDQWFADDYIDHGDGQRGVGPLKAQMAAFRHAFPDLHIQVNDTVESGDRVATRTTVTGTHTGDLMGMPPTGKTITVTAVDISRFSGDKAIERWGGLDTYALMMQLGAIPAPQPA